MATNDFLTLYDYERYATKFLEKPYHDFLQLGSGYDVTVNANTNAFSKYRIRPRCLRNVMNRDLNVTLFDDQVFQMPIGLSPTARQKRWTEEGEVATVKAAATSEALMIVSGASSVLLEDVIAAAPEDTILWMQMFFYQDRSITEDLVRRAEKSGYRAIVVSVDAPGVAEGELRYENKRNKYNEPIPMINYVRYQHLGEGTEDASDLSWSDVDWIVNLTNLPVILKGIVTAEDAVLAADHGVKGVLVSNHGGRQLDGVPATLEALPEIVKAVGDRIEVFLDGGVRSGTDVFKAIALGAKMVFVGRPICWGLFRNGQEGAKAVIEILRNELDIVMAFAGCSSLNEITKSHVKLIADYYQEHR